MYECTDFSICCFRHELVAMMHINIIFQDIMQRTYKQGFSYYYKFAMNNNKGVRIESYTPKLTKDIFKID
jgi:hypothetical protein